MSASDEDRVTADWLPAAVVRPDGAPEQTVLVVDAEPGDEVRVIAFDGAGRPVREARADTADEDHVGIAIASAADVTPEEAQALAARALAALGYAAQSVEDEGLGPVGILVACLVALYVVVLPVVGVVAIVRWLV
jgi:hypothetical protein